MAPIVRLPALASTAVSAHRTRAPAPPAAGSHRAYRRSGAIVAQEPCRAAVRFLLPIAGGRLPCAKKMARDSARAKVSGSLRGGAGKKPVANPATRRRVRDTPELPQYEKQAVCQELADALRKEIAARRSRNERLWQQHPCGRAAAATRTLLHNCGSGNEQVPARWAAAG